jgi:hypothetical protein
MLSERAAEAQRSALVNMKPQLPIVAGLLGIAIIFGNAHPRLPNKTLSTDFETRCGWLDNPTPANIWLYDRDGQWIIGVQGGYQLQDDMALPDFKPRQWVLTNVGSYGYGCACLRLRVNKQTHEVLEIKSSRARPLATCRQDQSLKKWKRMFK